MPLVLKRVPKGQPHPSPYLWGRFVEHLHGQDMTKAHAEKAFREYSSQGRDWKAYLHKNGMRAGGPSGPLALTADAWVIFWEEFGENEFGVEMP